jgi:EmrB/QacA subfamily drug resistance transporter
VNEFMENQARSRSDLRRRVVTTACMCSAFMVAIEVTIVGVAMPTIVGQLGDFNLFTWVFAAYILTSAVTAPIYGRLADLYGRKRMYYVGASLFLIGSLLCGFAQNMTWLIAFRAVQGIGSGALQPLTVTILSDLYGGQDRARVLAWQSSVWGLAAIFGPVIGAFIVAYMNWSYVFWINLPVGVVTLTVLALAFDERMERRDHKVDYLGSVLLMLGAGALLTAAVQSQDLSRDMLIALIVGGAIALAVLFFYERRAPEPIIPFTLWRIRTVTVSNLGALSIGVVLACTTLYLTAFVQGVLGYTALFAGAVYAGQSFAWSVGSVSAARLMDHFNFVTTAAIGGTLLMAGCIILAAMDRSAGIAWVCCGSFTVGVGMGLCNTTFVLACQSEVGWSDRGGAVSANIFLRMIGMAIGAGIGGALVNFWLARLTPGALDAVRQILDPVARLALGPSTLLEVSGAIGFALSYVYLAAIVFAAGAVICAFSLPSALRLQRQGT